VPGQEETGGDPGQRIHGDVRDQLNSQNHLSADCTD
jgi:hypothetical protein